MSACRRFRSFAGLCFGVMFGIPRSIQPLLLFPLGCEALAVCPILAFYDVLAIRQLV